MSATSLSRYICNLSKKLAENLRNGTALISDARMTEHNIRQAKGWLIAAERFMNPGDPLGNAGE